MKEQIKSYLADPRVSHGIAGAVGTALGLGVGYVMTRRKYKNRIVVLEGACDMQLSVMEDLNRRYTTLKSEWQGKIEAAIEAIRELQEEEGVEVTHNLKNLGPDDEVEIVVERIVQPDDPNQVQFEWSESLKDLVVDEDAQVEETDDGIVVTGKVTDEGAKVIRRIFDEANDEWDWELERRERIGKEIHTIHVDEYQSDELGWNEGTELIWYEGDKILCDERNQIVPKPENVIGTPQFGHGSDDPNMVFIRNHRLKADYQVLRDPGSYTVEVLGLDSGDEIEETYERQDLRHSRRPIRFRDE